MSVECKRLKDFADTLESFLCQSYIKRGGRLSEGICFGSVCQGEICPGGGAFVLPSCRSSQSFWIHLQYVTHYCYAYSIVLFVTACCRCSSFWKTLTNLLTANSQPCTTVDSRLALFVCTVGLSYGIFRSKRLIMTAICFARIFSFFLSNALLGGHRTELNHTLPHVRTWVRY